MASMASIKILDSWLLVLVLLSVLVGVFVLLFICLEKI